MLTLPPETAWWEGVCLDVRSEAVCILGEEHFGTSKLRRQNLR